MGFRRQLFVGYAASLAIAAVATSLAVIALRGSARDETQLAHRYADELVEVERLRFDAESVVAAARGYLVSRDASSREQLAAATASLESRVEHLSGASLADASADEVIAVAAAGHHYAALARGIAAEDPPDIGRSLEQMAGADRAELQDRVRALARRERTGFEDALARARAHAGHAGILVGLVGGLGIALSALLAALVIRRLARQHAAECAATATARRAAEAAEEVLRVVSHDLRNPLATIVTASDLLAMRVVDVDMRRQLGILRFAADRMRHLVDQIVDLAQLDAGRLRLELRRCDISRLLRDVADQFSDSAARHSVVLQCDPPAEPVFVTADVERIVQVLSNLVGNALKFTTSGGVIKLSARVTADTVVVSVEDSGQGIASDELERVFERHWRGATVSATRGLGLGLHICKHLVEAHHGRIWVVSREGAGACFHFTLPRELGPAVRASGPSHEPAILQDHHGSG